MITAEPGNRRQLILVTLYRLFIVVFFTSFLWYEISQGKVVATVLLCLVFGSILFFWTMHFYRWSRGIGKG